MDVYIYAAADRARPNFLSHPRHTMLVFGEHQRGRPQGASVCVCVCVFIASAWPAPTGAGEYVFWPRNHFASWNSSIKWQAREMWNLNDWIIPAAQEHENVITLWEKPRLVAIENEFI